MLAEPLLPLDGVDLDVSAYDRASLRDINPHRFEFEQLDYIVRYSEEPHGAIAVRDVRDDEFWVRGHFPKNPLFPGVLMVEAGAQAASFCFHMRFGKLVNKIFGFGGLDGIRFRGSVRPGDRLAIVVRADRVRMRRAIFDMQAWVDDRLVCEGKVIGVTIPTAVPDGV